MKRFFYRIFALCFFLGRLVPLNKNKFAFLHIHPEGEHGSLSNLEAEIKKRRPNGVFLRIFSEFRDRKNGSAVMVKCFTALKFLFIDSFRLASCGYVFLNDNFMPMEYMRFKSGAKIVQLWHGGGAFKRFGLASQLSEKQRRALIRGGKSLTHVICSGENVSEIYAEAFGTEKSRVYALGSARADFLLSFSGNFLRDEFEKKYPECKGKRLVLYAPTFRDSETADIGLFERADLVKLVKNLDDDVKLLIKLHPSCRAQGAVNGALDVTGELDINSAVFICDELITDYSSVVMDFSLLKKPVYMYPFDLENYRQGRDFYFEYENYVPGEVFFSPEELAKAVNRRQFSPEKQERFLSFNFDFLDSKSCKRIADELLIQ